MYGKYESQEGSGFHRFQKIRSVPKIMMVLLSISLLAATIQVIGGGGRMGSQWMRVLGQSAVAVPRGVSQLDNKTSNTTVVVVCTSASSWEQIYHDYQNDDLIFVGNGLPSRSMLEEDASTTFVIPHYAIPSVGATPPSTTGATASQPPPTYVYGKHAAWVRDTVLLPDGILHVHILTTPKQVSQHAARKLLWATCLWLLCHASKDEPISVRQVHEDYTEDLRALLQELWPAYVTHTQQQQQLCDDDSIMDDVEDTLSYLREYSLSIPSAVPSVQLALSELEVRNGVFARGEQLLHRELVRRVAGDDAVARIFEKKKKIEEERQHLKKLSIRLDHVGMTVHGQKPRSTSVRRVVVVGAGMLGSAIAARLVAHSAVTVVETQGSTKRGATTGASWAWINANRKAPAHYQQLNILGMHAWRNDPNVCQLVDWKGCLIRYREQAQSPTLAGGYYSAPIGPLSCSEWLALEPKAGFPVDAKSVYYYPHEGCVDPMDAVSQLRTAASKNGATFLWNSRVIHTKETSDGKHLVTIDNGEELLELQADVVVVAAGRGAASLCKLPMQDSPGQVSFSKPADATLDKILVDAVEQTHVLQRRDGTLVVGGGELVVGGLSPSKSQLNPSDPASPTNKGNVLIDPSTIKVSNSPPRIEQAVRPIPEDGLPAVGFLHPGCYVAATHSGVTLAPLLGALVATEVSHGLDLDILAPYRPSRFFLDAAVS